MKSHDRLTIVRNRYRARELKVFRDLVDVYFDRSQRDPDGVPVDWEGAQAARSRINQMLARIMGVVRAAEISGAAVTTATTDPGPRLGQVEVLQHIFSARYADGTEQEILDVLDMAIGVYDTGRPTALARTFNPFHYLGTAISFVARAPRWLLGELGLRRSARPERNRGGDLAHLEAAALRFRDAEALIDTRLAAHQDLQAVRLADNARQLAELAERLDFAERLLARHQPPQQIQAPKRSDITTPV